MNPAVESPKRLQNVFVVAERPAELHAFYESALGLQLKFRDKDRWIQYGVGNTSVALACREEALPATSGVVMVFEVDDFAATAQRVHAAYRGRLVGRAGCDFRRRIPDPGKWAARLDCARRSPDGPTGPDLPLHASRDRVHGARRPCPGHFVDDSP